MRSYHLIMAPSFGTQQGGGQQDSHALLCCMQGGLQAEEDKLS